MDRLWRYDGVCICCGQNKNEMTFLGGDWWCRSCMWAEFYDEDLAFNFVLINRDLFCERYPDGDDWIHRFTTTGDESGESHIEEFISENLEEYCDWCLGNPTIVRKELFRNGKHCE